MGEWHYDSPTPPLLLLARGTLGLRAAASSRSTSPSLAPDRPAIAFSQFTGDHQHRSAGKGARFTRA